MQICIIFNPAARSHQARRLQRQFESLGNGFDLKPTTGPGAARALAAAAVEEGYTTLVAAGGDGTLNEVLNGLADHPEGLRRARLAVLPLGTVNVFAREIGWPFQPRRALELIRAGRVRSMDFPVASGMTAGGTRRRHFLQLAGIGLDARSVELVDLRWKRRIGPLAYLMAMLQALREPPPRLTVRTETLTLHGAFALFGNGQFYGGPFRMFPRARLDDQLLDLTLVEDLKLLSICRTACALFAGRIEQCKGVKVLQAPSYQVEARGHAPLELDGELAEMATPLRFTLHPEPINVVIP